jgi:hypothetical protein
MESPKKFEAKVGFSGLMGKSGFFRSLPERVILTKVEPLGGAPPRGLEAEEENCGPATARVVKPWGQGHLDADPMLQRDSDNI